MKKTIKISKKFPHRPRVKVIEGTVNILDYPLSNGTVMVVKEGTRLLNIGGVENKLDLGWVKLEKTRRRKVFDLPELVETAFDGKAVWLRTQRYRDWVFLVSMSLWETQREEVEKYLLRMGPSRGIGLPLTLGGDPEFEVVDPESGEIIPATRVPLFVEGGLSGQIGLDNEYAIAEFRPAPAYSPEEYVENFLALVERVKEERVLLCTKGDLYPLGGHIHVGSSDNQIIRALKGEVESFVRVLDDFVGRVLLPTSGRGRGGYYGLFAYKHQPYGWEYRTPPASFYADLEMVRITYKLVKGLVEFLLKEGEISYETLEDGRAKPRSISVSSQKRRRNISSGFPRDGHGGKFLPLCPLAQRF
jgi:hypothetical protein